MCAFVDMEDVELLAVVVHGHVLSKVTTGSASCGEGGVSRLKSFDELGLAHAPADVVVREDRGAGLAEVLVAAGVIDVPVRVDHEAHRLGAQLRERLLDLGRQRRELVVDDDDAVLADRRADVAAGAGEHVDALRQLLRLDDDLAEVLLLRTAHGMHGEQRHQDPTTYALS